MDDNHEKHETHEKELIWFRPQAGLGFIRVPSVAENLITLVRRFRTAP